MYAVPPGGPQCLRSGIVSFARESSQSCIGPVHVDEPIMMSGGYCALPRISRAKGNFDAAALGKWRPLPGQLPQDKTVSRRHTWAGTHMLLLMHRAQIVRGSNLIVDRELHTLG
jgi:hypothetical protein